VSPRGDTIGVVIRDEEGDGSLALLDMAEKPAGVNVIAPIGHGKSVERFAWQPRGDGVLFLEGQRREGEVTSGTLVGWDRASNATRIIATGGQAGPTGSISWFTLAPDGKAVAYGVAVLTGEGWSFSGLYVRSLVFGQVYRVPVSGSDSVTDARWLDGGLAWIATDEAPGATQDVRIEWIDGSGQRRQIGEVAIGGATPVATPIASPVPASPAASPVATPIEATPGATPAR
jgi:hypothetical protein